MQLATGADRAAAGQLVAVGVPPVGPRYGREKGGPHGRRVHFGARDASSIREASSRVLETRVLAKVGDVRDLAGLYSRGKRLEARR